MPVFRFAPLYFIQTKRVHHVSVMHSFLFINPVIRDSVLFHSECTPRRTIPERSELALACCFRLLLALYGRLLIMFTLPNFSDDAVFCARTLETLQSGVQGLVLTNAYFCHEFFPPFVHRQRLSIKTHPLPDTPYKQLVKYMYIVSQIIRFVKLILPERSIPLVFR